jgi:predicted RNase H-like HicB family nuclease
MHREFSAVFERDGQWFIGYCPEVPGANGQGQSLEECRESLRAAIQLILEVRRDDALRGIPSDAIVETIDVA